MSYPTYTLKARWKEAIRIIYEGQDLGVFDLSGLWAEYRKAIYPNDSNKRYVIERAIEALEGKSPQMRKESGWVDRWEAGRPAARPSSTKKPKRSPVSRFLNWLRRFRF